MNKKSNLEKLNKMDSGEQLLGSVNLLGELFKVLPVELKCEIFKQLTVKERPAARETCQDWATVLDNHFEFKLVASDANSFRELVKKNKNSKKLWILFNNFNYGKKLLRQRWENSDFFKRITTAEFTLSLDIKNLGQLLKYLKNLKILTVNANVLKVDVKSFQIPKAKQSEKLRKLRELNLFIAGTGIKYINNVPTPGLHLLQTISPYIAQSSLQKIRLILFDATDSGKKGESLEDLILHGFLGPYLLGTEVKIEYKELHKIFDDNYKTLTQVELKNSSQNGFSTCRKCDQLHSFDFGTMFKLVPPKRRVFVDDFSKFTMNTFIAGFQSSTMPLPSKLDLLQTQTKLQHLAVKSVNRENKIAISKILKQNYATLTRIGLFYPTQANLDIEFGSNYWDCSIFGTITNLQWLFLEHYCGPYDGEVVEEHKMVHLTNLSKLPPSLKVFKTSFLITFVQSTLEQTTNEWENLKNLERLQLRRRPGWFQLSNGEETIYLIEPSHLEFLIKTLPGLKSLELLSKAPKPHLIPQNFQEQMHNANPITDEARTWISNFGSEDITLATITKNGNRHPIENIVRIGEKFRESLIRLGQEAEEMEMVPGGFEE